MVVVGCAAPGWWCGCGGRGGVGFATGAGCRAIGLAGVCADGRDGGDCRCGVDGRHVARAGAGVCGDGHGAASSATLMRGCAKGDDLSAAVY